jgi:hypothetical protein
MTGVHRCSVGGTVFPAPKLRQWELLTLGRRVSLDDYTKATCPKCGVQEDVSERRFLWVLGPAAFRVAMLAVAATLMLVALHEAWDALK